MVGGRLVEISRKEDPSGVRKKESINLLGQACSTGMKYYRLMTPWSSNIDNIDNYLGDSDYSVKPLTTNFLSHTIRDYLPVHI